MRKYRLQTNSEGKYRAQYKCAPFFWVKWEYLYIPHTYRIDFDSMDEAMEIIAKHRRDQEVERWDVIELDI